jgi:ABC-2 type transport system permease protein
MTFSFASRASAQGRTTVRKILIVAAREYKSAVRTKSFIVSLLLMPVLMGGSIAVQAFFKRQANVQERKFAIVDRTPGQKYFRLISEANDKHTKAEEEFRQEHKGEAREPIFKLTSITPQGGTKEEVDSQRLELSKEVRADKYMGFVDIGPDVGTPDWLVQRLKLKSGSEPNWRTALRYQTDHPTYQPFPTWFESELLVAITGKKLEGDVHRLVTPQGLTEEIGGKLVDPPITHQVSRLVLPAALVALMFMVVMLGSTPAMHGVVEEKMQRIAEVLLGSLQPFELMMGKLLGLMGVSLTVAAVYLSGAYWAAHRYEFTDLLPVQIIAWFVVFQALAVLMYGSLFLAIGAAATDIKETQSLVMPVILVACIPMFILSTALEDPNNPVVVATSFFPPVTPMLMLARQAISPGPPLWQPLVAVALVLAVTTLCVYAAGRIFRVGILMQGKGARIGQLLQWVVRG